MCTRGIRRSGRDSSENLDGRIQRMVASLRTQYEVYIVGPTPRPRVDGQSVWEDTQAFKLDRHFAEMLHTKDEVSTERRLGKIVQVGRSLCTRERGWSCATVVFRTSTGWIRDSSRIYALCEGKEVIVLGDFSPPAPDWLPSGSHRTYPPLERSFLDVFDALGLHQWVHDPTFPSSGSILDLVLTSEDDRMGHIQVIPPLPGADHCPILAEYIFSARIPSQTQDPQSRRAWHKGKYNRICSVLCETDWDAELDGLKANECFEFLTAKINSLVDDLVPLRQWFPNGGS